MYLCWGGNYAFFVGCDCGFCGLVPSMLPVCDVYTTILVSIPTADQDKRRNLRHLLGFNRPDPHGLNNPLPSIIASNVKQFHMVYPDNLDNCAIVWVTALWVSSVGGVLAGRYWVCLCCYAGGEIVREQENGFME